MILSTTGVLTGSNGNQSHQLILVTLVDAKTMFGISNNKQINNDITGNVKIQFIGRLDCILILYAVDSDGTQRIVAKATRLGKKC
jgi:hypothetical protein